MGKTPPEGVDPRTYRIWTGIKTRCFNKNEAVYDRYGGRGIGMCERWVESFEAFLEDMGSRPSPEHSIERIDNEGNYEPGNCRWATDAEQARNKRTNVWLSKDGVTLCLSDWAKRLGLCHSTLIWRMKQGWQIERVLSVSARSH